MQQWLVTIIAGAAVLAVIGVLVWRIGSSGRLRFRFGAKHDPVEDNANDAHDDARGERRVRLEQSEVGSLRSLSDEERARYVRWWRQVQRNAARQPATALLRADELLTKLLADAGYPPGGFLQHAEDVSADHAGVVDDYRAARNVVLDMRLGLAGTAEIRDAMLCYRRVFERLLDVEVTEEADETAA